MSATALVAEPEPILRRDDDGRVAILTLSRPAARNSLSRALLTALANELTAVAQDRAIRAIVLAADGAAFCAGHDLKELTVRRADTDGGRAFFQDTMTACSALMQQIVALPQPVVAAVQGMATAAGCQLVATCDLAVASSAARFATPGVDIGLFCSTPMVALSRSVSPKHAMEMLLLGEPVSAETALRMGLINAVVAPGEERAAALDLAHRIASKSAHAIGLGKAAFHRQIDKPLAAAYADATAVMAENMMAADAAEGIGAFLDKRPPRWPDN